MTGRWIVAGRLVTAATGVASVNDMNSPTEPQPPSQSRTGAPGGVNARHGCRSF